MFPEVAKFYPNNIFIIKAGKFSETFQVKTSESAVCLCVFGQLCITLVHLMNYGNTNICCPTLFFSSAHVSQLFFRLAGSDRALARFTPSKI